MFFEHRAFWLPKDIQRREAYQDAYEVDDFRGRASVADGVSGSLFSASWAQILSKAVVNDPPDLTDELSLPPWLAKQREQWIEPIDVESLAWHQKPKFEQGAHTTLLWVELYAADQADAGVPDASYLYCYAVGDSCLFHVRGEKTLKAFPLDQSSQFGDEPEVVGSINQKKDHQLQFKKLESYCQNGDLLVLCTDAIAAWAMASTEAGNPPSWHQYWEMGEEDWKNEVIQFREKQEMRFDDATLLLLRIDNKSTKGKPLDIESV